ncbi:MAG: hypothetical protein J7641_22715 [Cyanobacteria bacterium SID2]|nr:hypothetical protein [Cyanobacteria bacterium SID2]MBP0005229.1 hypothetical protein [Cyanobacteria bacterium SBC]
MSRTSSEVERQARPDRFWGSVLIGGTIPLYHWERTEPTESIEDYHSLDRRFEENETPEQTL